MFMAHIKHKHFDEVVEQLLSPTYGIKHYLVTAETAGYEHLHFMCYMTDKAYQAFSKSCFKDKHKLKGRAALRTDPDAGRPRQYGKETLVKSVDKAISYCLKDKGLYKTNMDETYIKSRLEASFQKQDKIKLMDECMTILENENFKDLKYTPNLWDSEKTSSAKEQILKRIIQFLIERDRPINKSICNSYFLNYLRTTQQYSLLDKTQKIYENLFGQHF